MSSDGRVLVAGAFHNPESLTTALQVAITDHPDATLIYRRDDKVGEIAVQWWAGQGLPFEPHEPEPNKHLQFIQANQLVIGDTDHPPADLVIVSVTGWLTFGRCCVNAAQKAGIPIIHIDT